MDGVVDDTRRGVSAIAPSADTPAGKRQLVDHLQAQLDRAKAQLRVSEQRNVLLAQAIRQGAGGYGGGSRMGGQMPGMSGMGGMGSMPSFGGGGGGGMSPGMAMPNLSALTNLGRTNHNRTAASAGLNLHPATYNQPGAEAFRAAVRRGLDIKGITDPVARANWEAGIMLVGDRESDFRNTVVNNGDSNARAGQTSAGTLQFTPGTFASYHEPGTATDRTDNVAQVCAFINYATGHYGVSADASDLAAKTQQADPTRPPKGY
jgi:hypothetical protein